MRNYMIMLFNITIIIMLSGVVMGNGSFNHLKNEKDNCSYNQDNFSDAPFLFIKNQGQWESNIHYYAKTNFGKVAIGNGCIHYYIQNYRNFSINPEQNIKYAFPNSSTNTTMCKIKISFINSNDVIPIGYERMNTKYNFFIGNNPEYWRTNVPSYKSIIIPDIYNDIDIKYYFDNGNLKYDFILKPYSDPDQILIQVDGNDDLIVTEEQVGIVCSNNNILYDKDLVCYYEDEDDNIIKSRFAYKNHNSYSFHLEKYDNKRITIIDPLIFSTFLGGSNNEYVNDVEVGPSGNIYIGGWTASDNFPITPGAYQTSNTGTECYISKFNFDGSQLLSSTYIGSSNIDCFSDINVDSKENVYLSAYLFTQYDDYPITDNAFDQDSNGQYDVVFSKFNSNLSTLVSSSYLGGSSSDYISKIAIDDDDDFYITCESSSTDFPTTTGAYDETGDGLVYTKDITVTKFNKDLSSMIFSSYVSSNTDDEIGDFLVDGEGNAIICGQTGSHFFPTTSGVIQTVNMGDTDGIIFKMKSDGSDLIAATYLGGSGREYLHGLSLDPNNNIYISGQTTSEDYYYSLGTFQDTFNGSYDGFITIVNENLTSVLYSTYFGSSKSDNIEELHVMLDGSILFCGTTSGIIPVTEDAFQNERKGGSTEGFIALLSSNLSQLHHSTYIGGNNYDMIFSMKVDKDMNIFISGYTNSTDFPISSNAYRKEINGSKDSFLMKYSIIPNSEPNSVFSLNVYQDDNFNMKIDTIDRNKMMYIELIGDDSNSSNCDFAVVNITLNRKQISMIPLKETGNNTGIYRGSYRTPVSIEYFSEIELYARIDNTKNVKIYVLPNNRPLNIQDIKIFDSPTYDNEISVADKNETVYIKLRGTDSNPTTLDTALINITDVNIVNEKPIIKQLQETGLNTGIYTGEFRIPVFSSYLDKFNFSSTIDETKKHTIIVNTHVLILPIEEVTTITEDQYYSVQYSNGGWQSDVSWHFNTDNDWLEFNENTLLLSGKPTNNDVGISNVWIDIEDNYGHKDSHEFQIHVINRIPTIIGQHELEIYQDSEYYIDYDSDDEGDGETTWHLATNASWLSLNKFNGVLTGSPTNADVGIFFVNIKVRDGNQGENISSFEIRVININDAPKIITSDITRVSQGEPYRRDYEVTDIDVGDYFVWSLSSIPAADWLTMNPSTGLLYGEPGPEAVGDYILNVTVTDSRGLMDSHEFTLTVENINDKPIFVDVPGDLSVYSGKYFRYDVNATDYDHNDELSYSISSIPKSDISIDSDTGEINWKSSLSFFDDPPYQLRVEVSVTDGEFTIKHDFKVTILMTDPPISELLYPTNGEKSSYQKTLLKWSGVDPEDEPITYDVYIGTTKVYVSSLKDETLYISDFEFTSLVVTGLDPSKTYYWTVIPYDGGSYGSCSSGVYSFRLNSVPEIKPIDFQTATTGETFRLLMQGSDSDSSDQSELIYSIEEGPSGMLIDENSGLIRWKPGSGDVGLHQVVVNLSDGIDTVKTSFTIEVEQGYTPSTIPVYLFVGIPGLVILIFIIVLLVVLIRKKGNSSASSASSDGNSDDEVIEEQVIGAVEEEKHPEFKSDVALSPSEAHAHLGKGSKSVSYEELYGVQAPVISDDSEVTTEELRNAIRQQITDLENMEE